MAKAADGHTESKQNREPPRTETTDLQVSVLEFDDHLSLERYLLLMSFVT